MIAAPGIAYRDLLEAFALPVAIFSGAPAITLIDANPAFLALFQSSKRPCRGHRMDAIFPPGIARKIAASVARGAQGVPADTFTSHAARAPLRGKYAVRSLGTGDEQLFLVSIELARERLSLTESRHAALFDWLSTLTNALTYILDLTTQQTRYINEHASELLNFPPQAMTSITAVAEIIHPDDLESFAKHMQDLRELGDDQIAHGIFRLRRADGSWRWIDNRARVFSRARNGKVRRVIGCALDLTEHYEAAEALENASAALAQAEEHERQRIAREMHDSTAQYLVAIDLGLGSLERDLEFSSGESHAALAETRRLLSQALREIRTISFVLHPPQLEEYGLDGALRMFVEGFARRAGLIADVHINGEQTALNPDAQLALFRIAQEALMNVRRHAKASQVIVRLAMGARTVELEVEDNGLGAKAWDQADHHPGVGVAGMRARMMQLGGTLAIEPSENGTIVRARISAHRAGAINEKIAS